MLVIVLYLSVVIRAAAGIFPDTDSLPGGVKEGSEVDHWQGVRWFTEESRQVRPRPHLADRRGFPPQVLCDKL